MQIAALVQPEAAQQWPQVEPIRNILVSGIKGYKRRVARCQASGTPLHRSANQSSGARRSKKTTSKNSVVQTGEQ
jgi:hypothetical protein